MEKLIKQEEYLSFKDKGIDVNACEIDYKTISVCCDDLSLYRKAFRVKIRSLIKQNDRVVLKEYVQAFYSLAQFVRYIYGFHSCNEQVQPWQERVALKLQKGFDINKTQLYTQEFWLVYKSVDVYIECFKNQYKEINLDVDTQSLDCIQDSKPFLNLKDRAHFDKCFTQ